MAEKQLDDKKRLDFEDEFQQFVNLMREGLIRGGEEYGPRAFYNNDLPGMMVEELRDLACYSFLQFLKVLELQRRLQENSNDLEGV